MIQIQDVSFEYEKEQGTLSHIDLNIQQGECVVLIGESGCGKTTVTKLINGLIPHFVEGGTLSGTTIVNGMEVPKTEMYRLAEQVGSVFQNPKSQFFNIDSDSEITFGLENAGVEPKKIKERYEATVSALKIQSLLGRNIFSMSGGEKQSLAFASVYAMNPSIFVLDEPTANLDADAIDTLRQQIIQIKKEGRTVVIAEHRLYFLMDLIDRAIFIQKGKIVQIFSGNEFRNLSDEQRIRMGLRSLVHPVLELPPADPSGAQEGLSVENLSCAFDKQPVFSGLGFSAKRGEVLGIVGHNGAGKTTMTRCLCGLLKEVNGTVRLDGQTLKAKQRNEASFCVMQDVNHQLFSDSVWNECELAQPDCPPERIEEILRSFDLLDFKDRHPMALSGGQKQRLAVATAILSNKDVLVFDEPTSGLDYHRMLEVSNMIRKLNDENKIIIIVSHDFEFLGRTCDKIFDMEGMLQRKEVASMPELLQEMYYGPNVQNLIESDDCKVMRLSDNSGEGMMTLYHVFPGVFLMYNDFHMKECVSGFQTDMDLLCIDHCREGRIEQEVGQNAFSYLEAGDLRVDRRIHHSGKVEFPLCHYHGISIGFQVETAAKEIPAYMKGFSVDLYELQNKYCSDRTPYVIPGEPAIEHIFSELYNVPVKIKKDYFKIKVLELLLYLDALELSGHTEERPYFYKGQVEKIKAIQSLLTQDLTKNYTLEELSAKFDIALTPMKNCFKSVYGSPIFTYMRNYRMNYAAALLKSDKSLKVADVAGLVGYDSPSKFTAAFHQTMGKTPLEYRKSII